MMALASPFPNSRVFASPIGRRSTPRSRIPSPLSPSASLQNTEEQHEHSPPTSSSSWISFFLADALWKRPIKPLLEDMSEPHEGGTALDKTASISHEHVKISPKKNPRIAKRVTFTPQKARELRQKLKGTDTFHDFMYHSAIASRLASDGS